MAPRARRGLALVLLLTALGPVRPGEPTGLGGNPPRVGFLFSGHPAAGAVGQVPGWLQMLGYREPRDVTYENRFAGGSEDRLPELAAELVRSRVDVIVTDGVAAVRAARAAAATLPTVMLLDRDPVGAGLVASLARPGGNLTGLVTPEAELTLKRLELLKAAVPAATTIAVLRGPDAPERAPEQRELEARARALGVALRPVEARTAEELEAAIQDAVGAGAGGLLVAVDRLSFAQARLITRVVTRHRLPAMYPSRWFVEVFAREGLMAYEASRVEVARRLAAYVDRILKGARPGDLPIEQPAAFDLVVNLQAARAIGLALPQPFLAGATRVIP